MRRLTKISGDRVHIVLKDPLFLNYKTQGLEYETIYEIDVIIKETHQGVLKGIDKDYQYMIVPLDKVIVPSLNIKKDDEEYKKEEQILKFMNKEVEVKCGNKDMILCIRDVYESFVECYLISDTTHKLLIPFSSILNIE